MESVKSILTERHQLALDNNSYWIFYILDAYKAYKANRAFHEGGGDEVGGGEGGFEGGEGLPRAQFVQDEAASHSTDRVAIHIEPLDPEMIRATVEEVFPLGGSLSLTLLPEVVADEGEAEGGTGVSQQGTEPEVTSSL